MTVEYQVILAAGRLNHNVKPYHINEIGVVSTWPLIATAGDILHIKVDTCIQISQREEAVRS